MNHSAEEMMTVAAARELRDGQVVFVGIDLPSRAANLARRLHAPGLVAARVQAGLRKDSWRTSRACRIGWLSSSAVVSARVKGELSTAVGRSSSGSSAR